MGKHTLMILMELKHFSSNYFSILLKQRETVNYLYILFMAITKILTGELSSWNSNSNFYLQFTKKYWVNVLLFEEELTIYSTSSRSTPNDTIWMWWWFSEIIWGFFFSSDKTIVFLYKFTPSKDDYTLEYINLYSFLLH